MTFPELLDAPEESVPYIYQLPYGDGGVGVGSTEIYGALGIIRDKCGASPLPFLGSGLSAEMCGFIRMVIGQ